LNMCDQKSLKTIDTNAIIPSKNVINVNYEFRFVSK